ncbi:MAG TPA: MBOAT family protein [Fibrobacteria bacterium]|nr:MBOAT family protein [Fibrobacteria bacterium]
MLFHSLEFVVFYLAIFLAYRAIPAPGKKPLLLAGSLWFYAAWDWRFLGLILVSSGTDFLCGRRIAGETRPAARKTWLWISLGMNLGILGFFKYFGFFLESFRAVFPHIPEPGLAIILPVGISFFTFQSLSYTIDIYRGQVKPVPALDFFLFVAFFPQLLAGPIVRAAEFLPQLKRLPPFAREDVREGALLFARGFCKKVFLANLLARFADPVFARPESAGALECLLALYAFAFQIYWDFSGYTDMARGSALALGFRFPENFNLPYLSASLREFWRRWHMTLSSWLRDYLYKSLGGDRHGLWATLRNLFLTMALGGLWHGANWTFVVWGCYHGALLAIQRLPPRRDPQERRDRLGNTSDTWRPVRVLFTFHLVCLGWVFFRAGSVGLALRFLGRLASGPWGPTPALGAAAAALFACAAWQALSEAMRIREAADPGRPPSRLWHGAQWAAVAVGVALAFVYSTESAPFIYFQF